MASKNSSGESYGKGRTRNWNILIYPSKEQLEELKSEYDGSDGYGTAPDNWRDVIDEERVEWFESPLHEYDKNPDGTLKKPHWHITIKYESVKTYEQVKELTDKLNTTKPEVCKNIKGSVMYMTHLHNPDKYQYDVKDIKVHGGADLAEILKPTATERYYLIGEMMDFVREQDITEMEDLLYHARVNRFDDWFPLLCDNSAYIMGSMIKSRRHRAEQPMKTRIVKVDADGVIIEDS